MRISEILVSQRKLRAVEQLDDMMRVIANGGFLPPIVLIRAADDLMQVQDGHHRLAALWLAGHRELRAEDYLLVESDRLRPRFGNIVDLLNRC